MKKVLAALFVLYALIGIFLVPYLLKTQLPNIVKEATKADFSVERIHFNPFIFELNLHKIRFDDQ